MSGRVQVTRAIAGSGLAMIYTMQVCVVEDATDEEILAACNRENPSGTEHGWATVHRVSEGSPEEGGTEGPVRCANDPARLHILVTC